MNIKNALTVVAAACAVFAQAAVAQPASAPSSRAEVKADTKAAAKQGELTKAGEGPGTMGSGGTLAAPDKGTHGMTTGSGSTTRAERKATTKAAAKEGELIKAGEGPGTMGSGANLAAPGKGKHGGMGTGDTAGSSSTTRAERKATTKAAAKDGELIKAGEGPGAMGSGSTPAAPGKGTAGGMTPAK